MKQCVCNQSKGIYQIDLDNPEYKRFITDQHINPYTVLHLIPDVIHKSTITDFNKVELLINGYLILSPTKENAIAACLNLPSGQISINAEGEGFSFRSDRLLEIQNFDYTQTPAFYLNTYNLNYQKLMKLDGYTAKLNFLHSKEIKSDVLSLLPDKVLGFKMDKEMKTKLFIGKSIILPTGTELCLNSELGCLYAVRKIKGKTSTVSVPRFAVSFKGYIEPSWTLINSKNNRFL